MNKLHCQITKIDSQDGLCFIHLDCEGKTLGVMGLDDGFCVGQSVWANFKESDVMIALNSCISARNKFLSTILCIEHNLILARLTLGFHSHKIFSLISYEALKELQLKAGMECFWFVKSNDILLLRD